MKVGFMYRRDSSAYQVNESLHPREHAKYAQPTTRFYVPGGEKGMIIPKKKGRNWGGRLRTRQSNNEIVEISP
jgi:hypothetical protein